MKLPTAVNLPRDHALHWPDLCILCSRDSPATRTCYRSDTQSLLNWIVGVRETVSIDVPACHRCRFVLWFLAICRGLMMSTIVIAAMAVLLPMLEDEPDAGTHLWAWIGVGVSCFAALIFVYFRFPPVFDFTPYGESVGYNFDSESYADAFVVANLDAEWVLVDGVNVRDEVSPLIHEQNREPE